MGTNIRLTEEQIDRMMKRLVSEQSAPGVKQFQKGQYQGYKTNNYKATGSNLFKMGKDQIEGSNPQITDLILKVQDAVKKAAPGNISVTVNGGASNTVWGNNPAGSPEAIKKNKELATKRRDNLITFLKSKVSSPFVSFVPGTAVVGNVNSKDMEKDQFVSISVNGKGTEGKINVDRDNTSIQYNVYDKKTKKTGGDDGGGGITKYKRVCVKIPVNLVDKYRVKVREFGQEQNLGDIPFGVYEIK